MKNTPGDLLHIEAGTPHQPVNLSEDEPVIALVACNYDQNDHANCRLHDLMRGVPLAGDAQRRPTQVDELGSELAAQLVEGWSAFTKSSRFRELAEFAHFLDASEEFQTVHRPRHPHPAHEFAAREMGIAFMDALRRRALHLDGWFPGRFDASLEEAWAEPFVDGKGEAHEVVARVFHSAVLRADGTEVCRLSVAFPHLHDGFGFPFPPLVSVTPRR
jgi:hypothetical protein